MQTGLKEIGDKLYFFNLETGAAYDGFFKYKWEYLLFWRNKAAIGGFTIVD